MGRANRSLILVRDRLGVKPLVYFAADGEIAFASTIDALQAAGHGDEIDPVRSWICWSSVSSRNAGHLQGNLEAAASHHCRMARWPTDTTAVLVAEDDRCQPLQISFEEAVEETETTANRVGWSRLVSDVPIGALLSGGVDSTLVCWAMRELNADITAFTVRAPSDPGRRELGCQSNSQAGWAFRTKSSTCRRSGGLDELLDAFCEPFAVFVGTAHAVGVQSL